MVELNTGEDILNTNIIMTPCLIAAGCGLKESER